jgi:hypothetical protein
MKFKLCILILLFLLIQFSSTALTQTAGQDTLKELMSKIEILTEEIEKEKLGAVSKRKYESKHGLGPAASQVYHKEDAGVSLAGYGELVLQVFADKSDDNLKSNKTNQIDYLRNIVYVGYKFNERFLFNSEIEFEHALIGDSKPGEVAMEFGYIDAEVARDIAIRTGLVLIPVGIINEFHEPSTFFGSLRPETERYIIPTTWRAAGLGAVGGTVSGIGFRAYVIESLNAAKFSSDGIRSGRQNAAEAIAEDFGISFRLEYTGVPGLNIGISTFSGKTGQGLTDSIGTSVNPNTTILSLHGIFVRKGFEIRALYVSTWISHVTQLNHALKFTDSKSVGERQFGYYITVAYDFFQLIKPGTKALLQAFFQYEHLNPQSEVPSGFSANQALDRKNLTVGLMYKPIINIAFKLDYVNRDNQAGTALDQINAAVTYLF